MKPIPELRVISPQTAEREGFAPITTAISLEREPDIFASIQTTLKDSGAVWIERNGNYTAARPKRDLLEIERLVTKDDRREDSIRRAAL